MDRQLSIRDTYPNKTPAQITAEQIRAFELRLMGYSLRKIAEIMTAEGTPMTYSTVDRRVKAEIQSRVEPLVEEYISMELAKLDEMETFLYAKCQQGDDKAINARLRIMERRARLLGLDAPEKIDHRVSAGDKEVDAWMSSPADDEPDVLDGEVVDE